MEAIHYLDDLLIAGAAGRDQCAASVRVTLSVCKHLRVPVAFDKLEGPSTQITFLGIFLDSEALTLSLPQEKLAEILQLVQSWLSRRRASKRELLSFTGKLSFAAKVVPAGRLFLRRLIDLSTTVAKLHHHIRVTADARADTAWWACFLPSWNGVSMFLDPSWTDADTLNLFTDASGTLGFGAYFDGSWFRGSWLPHQELSQRSIQWQALFAIVAAAHTWGHRLAGRRIRFHCDNLAVVYTWNGQSPRGTPQSWDYYVSCSMWPHVTTLPSNWCTYRASITLWQMLYLEIHLYAFTFFHTCSTGRPSTNSRASDISRSLDWDLASLVSKALAGSTTATYKVGIRRYITFCRHLDVATVPSTRRHIALFATHLSSYLRLPTIRVYLAAVSFLNQASGHRSPVGNNPLLKLVIRGIRRKQAQLPLSKPRLSITPKILQDLI